MACLLQNPLSVLKELDCQSIANNEERGFPVHRVRVFVSSPSKLVWDFLKDRLPAARFSVTAVQPGATFLETVRREHPDIAVIDCFEKNVEAAQLEISLLKDIQPEVRIIALSKESSPEDALIVELGVFYYMTAPVGMELVQVIEAAAGSISRKAKTESQ